MRWLSPRRTTRLAAALLPIALIVTSADGTASAAPTPKATDTVAVVGYSIVANAYTALESAFQKTKAGKNVKFTNSFGASTTQADAVVSGQPADVVNFSTESDMQLLVDQGIVSSNWSTSGAGKAEGGYVSNSVVVLVVRKGNPLGIAGWGDLTKPGVQIVTPDPISSGSARWNLLEAYESQITQKRTAAVAKSFTNKVVGNVVAEPTSGSKALSTFLAGTGNVLLAYEADAANALALGDAIQIVYPKQNILIQTPAALTDNAKEGVHNSGAVAFFSFLFSSLGQHIWAANHFRPTLASVVKSTAKEFPHTYSAANLTTIAELKGWPAVIQKFFSQPNGIITKIEAAHGYTS
jgi:sulfate/thiosulfate transport system substrate-binding protein